MGGQWAGSGRVATATKIAARDQGTLWSDGRNSLRLHQLDTLATRPADSHKAITNPPKAVKVRCYRGNEVETDFISISICVSHITNIVSHRWFPPRSTSLSSRSVRSTITLGSRRPCPTNEPDAMRGICESRRVRLLMEDQSIDSMYRHEALRASPE